MTSPGAVTPPRTPGGAPNGVTHAPGGAPNGVTHAPGGAPNGVTHAPGGALNTVNHAPVAPAVKAPPVKPKAPPKEDKREHGDKPR